MNRLLVVFMFLPGLLLGQGTDSEQWSVRPTLALMKYLPGKDIQVDCPECYNSNPTTYRFAGTGLAFNVRAIHPSISGLAFTLGTGVNWYYSPDGEFYRTTTNAAGGIGETLKKESFETFPLNAGIQLYFPKTNPEALMGFVGVEGAIHFIDGDLTIGNQTQLGYAFLGGFAFKIFEMGVRYSSFSDISNIGVHFGFRLPAVQL